MGSSPITRSKMQPIQVAFGIYDSKEQFTMNQPAKVGQRIIYKDSSWHFICEVIELPGKYRIVQYFHGSCSLGYIGSSSTSFQSEVWTYLEGQDKP